jgi:hypothetical protein
MTALSEFLSGQSVIIHRTIDDKVLKQRRACLFNIILFNIVAIEFQSMERRTDHPLVLSAMFGFVRKEKSQPDPFTISSR